jgi:hypothetical protein
MTAHKHAQKMLLYAQDAIETDQPWERWEENLTTSWETCTTHPIWDENLEYRRKKSTININGFDVPEPIREYSYDRIWTFNLIEPLNTILDFSSPYWNYGLIHRTKEDAELHRKALISFTLR